MIGCWNTAVRDGFLRWEESKDEILKSIIPLTMSKITFYQGKVNCTHHPANECNFSSHRRICWAINTCQVRMHNSCLFLCSVGVCTCLYAVALRIPLVHKTDRPWKRQRDSEWHRGAFFFLYYFIFAFFSALVYEKRDARGMVRSAPRPSRNINVPVCICLHQVAVPHPSICLSLQCNWSFGMACRHPCSLCLVGRRFQAEWGWHPLPLLSDRQSVWIEEAKLKTAEADFLVFLDSWNKGQKGAVCALQLTSSAIATHLVMRYRYNLSRKLNTALSQKHRAMLSFEESN